MTARVPIVVLGGSGYVAGEALRLLAAHPVLDLVAVVSTSHAGQRIAEIFPHLGGTAAGEAAFAAPGDLDRLWERGRRVALLSALPHGTGGLVAEVLERAAAAGADVAAVDLSADFRFAEAARYEAIYGRPHPAPQLLPSFTCALPEHLTGPPPRHVAHPGCFTTAAVLAAWPLLAAGLAVREVFVAAVTGSSGSGRTPGRATHHPERRSSLHAYAPLAHRHEAEMAQLLAAAGPGGPPQVDFVPHSGPFVRGIHATLRLALREPMAPADVLAAFDAAYAGQPFVTAGPDPPRLTDVAGTNGCRLGVAVRGRTVVVTSVIDNLVKGAAGGGVQWLNRMLGLPDDTGLRLPGWGWY